LLWKNFICQSACAVAELQTFRIKNNKIFSRVVAAASRNIKKNRGGKGRFLEIKRFASPER
jgi:hypothetical protein